MKVINKIDKVEVNLQTDPNMTLWDAIKLRIAGHRKISQMITEGLEKAFQYSDSIDEKEHAEKQGLIQ